MDLSREDIRRQLDLEAESRSLGEARYDRSRPMPWRDHDRRCRGGGQPPARPAPPPPGRRAHRRGDPRVRHQGQRREGRPPPLGRQVARAGEPRGGRLPHRPRGPQPQRGPATWLRAAAINAATRSSTTSTWSRSRARTPRLLRAHQEEPVLGAPPGASSRPQDARDEEPAPPSPGQEKLHLGMAAIELLIDATGLFVIDTAHARTAAATTSAHRGGRKWLTSSTRARPDASRSLCRWSSARGAGRTSAPAATSARLPAKAWSRPATGPSGAARRGRPQRSSSRPSTTSKRRLGGSTAGSST
jgi:hypothetical protein